MRIHLVLILLMCGCAPSPRIQLGSESSESQFTLTFPSQAKTFQIVFHALPEATVLWRVETPRTEGGAAEATGSREVNLNYGSVPATLTQTFPSGGAKPRPLRELEVIWVNAIYETGGYWYPVEHADKRFRWSKGRFEEVAR